MSFSKILSGRYKIHRNDYKKLCKQPSNTSEKAKKAILMDEYLNFILPIVVKDGIDFDASVEAIPGPSISQVEILLRLIYFGFLFSFDSNDEFKWMKEYRLSERIRCLIYSYKLNLSDIDSISAFGSMISRPHVGFSHRESLEKCSEYVRRWLSGSLDFISEGSPTYSLLRDHVRTIVGSDYFTTPPPPPTHIEYQQHINFPWTLEEWLQINQSKILETQVLPGSNIQCTQWRLTQEVRTIIGGILKSFKCIHEQFYVCGQLNTQNIMLSEGLDVKLTDVKLVRGNKASFKDDFSKLKEIIEKIIHNVAGNGNVPKDVLHFMSFLGKPMDSVLLKMLYNHPCTWSAYDVIKNVSLFRMVIECSTIVSKEVTYAMNYMPGEIYTNWRSMVPKKSSMETFKNDWIENYSDGEGPLEILYFMRDAYPHFHKTLEPTETEGQLFALFPNYLAFFVWLTHRIDGIAEIYTKSTFDFIDAKDKKKVTS
ncbi:hypothetical protein ACSBR2_021645 [Camellia fascicularis]